MLSLLAGVGRRHAVQAAARAAGSPAVMGGRREGVWVCSSSVRCMHDTSKRGGSNSKKFKRRGSLAWLEKKRDDTGDKIDNVNSPLPGGEEGEAYNREKLVDTGVLGNMKRFSGSPEMPVMNPGDAMADVFDLFKKVVTFDTSKPDPRSSRDTIGLIFRNVDQANRLLEKARAAYPPKTPEQEASPASAVPDEVYNKMIRQLTFAWNLRGAMRVLEEMREKAGLKPSVEAYGALVCGWERNLDVEMANKLRRLCFDDHPGIDVDEAMPRELEKAMEDLHADFISKYGVPERNLTPKEYLEQQAQKQ